MPVFACGLRGRDLAARLDGAAPESRGLGLGDKAAPGACVASVACGIGVCLDGDAIAVFGVRQPSVSGIRVRLEAIFTTCVWSSVSHASTPMASASERPSLTPVSCVGDDA